MRFNDRAVGVTTLDVINVEMGISRSVAVTEHEQGNGHGKVLGKLVQQFARNLGLIKICVNADSEKTGYYLSLGFSPEDWDSKEMAPGILQMKYDL